MPFFNLKYFGSEECKSMNSAIIQFTYFYEGYILDLLGMKNRFSFSVK